MRLVTLGGLRLKGSAFTRPKPLLLLVYLSLEHSQSRRDIATLFFPTTKDPMQSLRANLLHLNKEANGAVQSNEQKIWTELPCDALELLAAFNQGDFHKTLELYKGPFLEDFDTSELNAELETWLYETREGLAVNVRDAHLALGERFASQGKLSEGAKHAEQAYLLRGAPEPSSEILGRMYLLLRAGNSPQVESVLKEAKGYGLELPLEHLSAAKASVLEAASTMSELSTDSSSNDAAELSGLELLPPTLQPPAIQPPAPQPRSKFFVALSLVLVAGLLAGFLFFRNRSPVLPQPTEESVGIDDADIALHEDYWCSNFSGLDLTSSIPQQNTAIRFLVEMPPNTMLSNATLRLVASKTTETLNGEGFMIHGVFDASPWLPSDTCDDSQAAAHDYRNRTRTSASVTYQPAQWQANKPYAIDVTAIVQEVIDNPTWTGGAVAFAIEKFENALVDITAYSSEGSGPDPNKQAKLFLYYEADATLKHSSTTEAVR